MKLKFTGFFLLMGLVLKAQLLSWTPEFFGDNATITITMDASFGNRGLFGHTASDVYVHTGVITSSSTTPTDWRYVKFNQNFTQPNPSLLATSLGNNRWSFTINNIRAYYGVPANETILKVAILFRSGNGAKVQRNGDGSDMYITVLANPTQQAIRITNPFREPRFIPFTPPVCRAVGEQITLEAKSSVTSQLKLIYNGNVVASTNGTSVTTSTTIAAAGRQQIIAESVVAGVTPTFTFNGNGAWTNPANWSGGNQPPNTIPAGTEIIINPAPGGTCVIDVNSTPITFAQGSKLTVANGANLVINGNLNVPQQSEFTGGNSIVRDTIEFFVAAPTPVAPLPNGVQENGVTYSNNNTTATLVLYAPNKNNIVVIGDFNDWKPTLAHQMNRTPDGLRYWVTIDGLTPGEEYAYQYIIDCNLIVADYNSEKILDPWNDPFIPAQTYPNLKPYPTGKASDIVSVLEPGKPTYNWVNNNFVRPNKANLICYELLIRDFISPANFQAIIDTLPDLASLGFNCLKLMPVTEFENNNSWGYNPSFMFAVDKAYGTENKLRELIDSCHGRGIAVVLDMVLNHQFGQSPMVRMYWDAANNKPAANSPWFNPDARHPFNVGFDLNHEAPATIEFVERVMNHWLTKFRFDGFRWDLSKGFTQRNTPNDVAAWNQYDQSRINIWQRIYDQSQAISPNCYMILEHLGNDDEEAELAKRGMLLWGKMTEQFNEATMGFIPNSNFQRAYHTTRWSAFGGNNVPHLVAYAESHDEERLMYKNRRFGNQRIPPASPPFYDTRTVEEASRRMQMVAGFLFTIPGPKMLWQFSELGYDASINMCEDFTTPNNDNCRTARKPLVTAMPNPFYSATVPLGGFTFLNYRTNASRNAIRDTYARMMSLRTKNSAYLPTFTTNDVSFNLSGGFKWQIIQSGSLRIVVVGNFDMTQQFGTVNFPTTGTWQVYAHNVNVAFNTINGNLTATTMNVTTPNQGFTLRPGTFIVFIDRPAVLGFNLNSFEAKMAAGNVEIDWQVEGEAHVAGYELERSFDGLHFEVLESRKGGTGLPGSRYKFTDGNRSVVFSDKPVHYRLRVTDTNGGYLYSNTVEVQPGLGISRLAPLASEGVVPMKP
jgi:1,4-alpha-glucan branching enzyme